MAVLYLGLPACCADGARCNGIIETPKGSQNKFDYDPEFGHIRLGGVLPLGAVFPFGFGFVPSTRGSDGDLLDVLVLMDEPAFTGCLVTVRLLGVIEAEQTEGGQTMRNDRLIAVAANSRNHHDVRSLRDITANRFDESEHCFISHNASKGKRFIPLGRSDRDRARQIVHAGRTVAREAGR